MAMLSLRQHSRVKRVGEKCGEVGGVLIWTLFVLGWFGKINFLSAATEFPIAKVAAYSWNMQNFVECSLPKTS